MIKSISFIVLTNFFHFNELKILRQPDYFIHQVKTTIYFYSVCSGRYFSWSNRFLADYSYIFPIECPASSTLIIRKQTW